MRSMDEAYRKDLLEGIRIIRNTTRNAGTRGPSDSHKEEMDQFIFSLLVWFDGMSDYPGEAPLPIRRIAASKDEMMHDEWVKLTTK